MGHKRLNVEQKHFSGQSSIGEFIEWNKTEKSMANGMKFYAQIMFISWCLSHWSEI